MNTLISICLMVATITVHTAMPIGCPNSVNDAQAMAYLKAYHYMGVDSPDPNIAAMNDSEGYELGLLSFQRMYGMEGTGTLTKETKALMALPRCGMVDVNSVEDTHLDTGGKKRKKQFAVHGSTWPQTSLTYKITQYTPDLTKAEVDSVIRRAFDLWENVTPLRFSQVGPHLIADIVIFFQARSHGDGYPFDGRLGTLAHAFYPLDGGDAHFDEDEVWTINTFSGINLLQLATHEFGHSLGLYHSSDSNAVMAPFYSGYIPNLALHKDDIDGIQYLYGTPSSNSTTTEGPSTTPFVPSDPDLADLCADGILDAVTHHEEQDGNVRTYVFRKDYYVELYDDRVAEGYPKKISEGWPGLPNDIDTALYWGAKYRYFTIWKDKKWQKIQKKTSPSRTYFFKGSLYWRFRNRVLDQGYPKPIDTWNLPNDLDAAVLLWGNDDSLELSYFFKGDSYYRYNRTQNQLLSNNPSHLNGFSSGVDSAFFHRELTYLTKGSGLYLVDGDIFKVSQGYPKDTRTEFLGCNHLHNLRSDSTVNPAGSPTDP